MKTPSRLKWISAAAGLALLALGGTMTAKQANAYDPPGNNPVGAVCDFGRYPKWCAAPTQAHRDTSTPGVTLVWSFNDDAYSHPTSFAVYQGFTKYSIPTGPWTEYALDSQQYAWTDARFRSGDTPTYYVCSEYALDPGFEGENPNTYELCAAPISVGSNNPPSPPPGPPNGPPNNPGNPDICITKPHYCAGPPTLTGGPDLTAWTDGQGFSAHIAWQNWLDNDVVVHYTGVRIRRFFGWDGTIGTLPEHEWTLPAPNDKYSVFDDDSLQPSVNTGPSQTTRQYKYQVCTLYAVTDYNAPGGEGKRFPADQYCIWTPVISMPHEPPKAPKLDVTPCADSGPLSCPRYPKGTVWLTWTLYENRGPDGGRFIVQSQTPTGWQDRVQLDPSASQWFDTQPTWDKLHSANYRICAEGDWGTGGTPVRTCSAPAGTGSTLNIHLGH